MKTWLKRLMIAIVIIALIGLVAWGGYLFPNLASKGWVLPVAGTVICGLLFVGHKGTNN